MAGAFAASCKERGAGTNVARWRATGADTGVAADATEAAEEVDGIFIPSFLTDVLEPAKSAGSP